MKRLAIVAVLLISCSLAAFQGSRSGVLKGYIVNLEGNPIAGAQVEVVFESSDINYKRSTKSKDNGEFRFLGMPSGKVKVTVAKTAFLNGSYLYEAKQSEHFALIRLLKEGQTIEDLKPQPLITGLIVDTKDNPIPEVSLEVTSSSLPGLKRTGMSKADGSFEIEGLKNAYISILASKEGFQPRYYNFEMSDKPVEIKRGKYFLKSAEEVYAEMGINPKRELTNEEKAVDFYNEAVGPFKAGDYAKAREMALKAVALDPKLEPAVRLVTYSGYHTKDWPEVLKYSEMYLKLKPGDEKMMQLAAEASRLTGKSGKAAEYKEQIRQAKGITPDSLYAEAVEAINGGDDTLARKRLDELMKMDEKFSEAYFEYGKIHIREGDFEQAVAKLKLFLKYASKDHKSREEATDLVVTLSE